LANTPEFAHAQRQRKKVEALFAELKNQIGLRRLRLRRLKFVREQFFLAAVAQNPQPRPTVNPARDQIVELPARRSRTTRALERTKRILSRRTFSTPTGCFAN